MEAASNFVNLSVKKCGCFITFLGRVGVMVNMNSGVSSLSVATKDHDQGRITLCCPVWKKAEMQKGKG